MSAISRSAKFGSMTGSAAAGMSGLRAGTVFGRKKKSPRTGRLESPNVKKTPVADGVVVPPRGPKKTFLRHGRPRYGDVGAGNRVERGVRDSARRTDRPRRGSRRRVQSAGSRVRTTGGGKTLGPRARSRITFGRSRRSYK